MEFVVSLGRGRGGKHHFFLTWGGAFLGHFFRPHGASRAKMVLPKTLKNKLFFNVFGISGISRELPVPRLSHQKPVKTHGFSMFLGFQAFLESFKSQDGPTKNIKRTHCIFYVLGFQACLETCIALQKP